MAAITPNRQGLKDLADFNIDSQFCQQYGQQVFGYQGDVTSQYQQVCLDFLVLLNDLAEDIQELQKQVPPVNESKGKKE